MKARRFECPSAGLKLRGLLRKARYVLGISSGLAIAVHLAFAQLEVARREMMVMDRYRYEVINDRVERAVQEICNILMSHVGD